MVTYNKSLYTSLVMATLLLGLCLGSSACAMGKKHVPTGAWLDSSGKLQHGSLVQQAHDRQRQPVWHDIAPAATDMSAPMQPVAGEQHAYTITNKFPYPVYVAIDGNTGIIRSGEGVETLLSTSSGVNFNVSSFVGLHPSSGGLAPKRPVIKVDLAFRRNADQVGNHAEFEIGAITADGKPITFDSKGLATSYPTITYPIKFIIRQQGGSGVPAGTIVNDKIINKEEVLEENVQLP